MKVQRQHLNVDYTKLLEAQLKAKTIPKSHTKNLQKSLRRFKIAVFQKLNST